jgi:hypothetical protein
MAGYAAAQKSSDHPLIGRVEGSTLEHQEVSNLNQYKLGTGSVVNDTVNVVMDIEGKVTMSWYKAENLSSFEIVKTYREMLKSKGFELIFSCDKGNCGKNAAGSYYSLAPFISDYGYNNSAPITHGSDDATYITVAKGMIDGKVFYVNIIVTQGWWKFPVYKIDVIEMVKKDLSVVNVQNEKQVNDDKKEKVKKDSETAEYKKFSVKGGAGMHAFIDPVMSGTNYFLTTYQSGNGHVTGSMTGFRFIQGPYFAFRWYFRSSLGLTADVLVLNAEEEEWTELYKYKSNASMSMQRLGLAARFAGSDVPVVFSPGLGIGHCHADLYQSVVSIDNSAGSYYLKGNGSFPVLFMNFDITYPIYKGLQLSVQFEYNVVPAGNFYMQHDGGSDYQMMYKSIHFGGFDFRLMLSYSF